MNENAEAGVDSAKHDRDALRVYLDTSRLDLLTRVRRDVPARYAQFQQFWRAKNCALVITRPHLLELRRHDNDEVREGRYALFENLTPVVSDIARGEGIQGGPTLVMEREIVRAYVLTGRVSGATETSQAELLAWCSMFPWRWETAESVSQLRIFEGGIFRFATDALRTALEAAASTRQRPAGTPYRSPQLDALPDEPISAEAADQARAQIETLLQDRRWWNKLLAPWPLEIREQVREFLVAATRDLSYANIESLATVGPWQTAQAVLGTLSEDEERRGPLDRNLHDLMFRRSRERVLIEYFNLADNARLVDARAAITREDCPGTWICNATEIALRTARQNVVANHELDLAHLEYLPYVDVMVADNEMRELARQVLSHSELPKWMQSIKHPVRAGTIDAIETAIKDASPTDRLLS